MTQGGNGASDERTARSSQDWNTGADVAASPRLTNRRAAITWGQHLAALTALTDDRKPGFAVLDLLKRKLRSCSHPILRYAATATLRVINHSSTVSLTITTNCANIRPKALVLNVPTLVA